MALHNLLYLLIALLYAEAFLHSLAERRPHCASREVMIAALYLGLSLLDSGAFHLESVPSFLPLIA